MSQKNDFSYALPSQYLLGQGQYVINKVLGSGGYGITYLAWDRRYNRNVAIKELFPKRIVMRDAHVPMVRVKRENQQEFEHLKTRFCQEAQKLYELRELKEIPQVYHLFEENATVYYAMEFLEGMDLKTYLMQNGTMTWEEISHFLPMIFYALHVLHGRNLIHRDITPDNIFLLKDGGAKLIDLGSVRQFDAGPMTVLLKNRFAPFEQYRENGRQGPWTDIYSLSVTIYYALSGVLPPIAPDRMVEWQQSKKREDGITPLEELCPNLPISIAMAVRKGLAVEEKDRWQNVNIYYKQLFGTEIPHPIEESKDVVTEPKKVHSIKLRCIRGYYLDKEMDLSAEIVITIGRNPNCTIIYPKEAPGISRVQCTIYVDAKGIFYIRDEKSTYGTVVNGSRLNPLEWYLLQVNDRICFGREEYLIREE